jgi:hypothetical protein
MAPQGDRRVSRLLAVLAAVVLAVQAGCLRHSVDEHGGGCKT